VTPPDSSPADAQTQTTIPLGWLGFCQNEPKDCVEKNTNLAPAHLSSKSIAIINRTNRWVNTTIHPRSDQRQWGIKDLWSYPDNGEGDCEDYALLKRRMLLEEDFPPSSLLITIVRNRKGEGHAVLMVRTDRGDFVLDNLSDEMLPWSQTGYQFIKRQSENNPNIWVKLKNASDEEKIVTQ
jgi:predicted transglutaminase-like cysteine proteinase